MPRYELIEGSSKKFWEIALEGSSFTTTYGRIGTDGQSSMKEYDSDEKAQKEHDKLIAEKTKKGYVLVDGAGTAAVAPEPVKAAPKPAAGKATKPVFGDEGDDEDEDEDESEGEAPTAKAGSPVDKKPARKKAAEKSASPAKAPPAAGASKSGEAGARYFEFVDGASSKFWEIKLEGTAFTTRYGKIGTEGQISMKEYESEEKAQKEHDKLVAEKTRKGYAEK
jgi:predicted DNA-binding WGR domain protein